MLPSFNFDWPYYKHPPGKYINFNVNQYAVQNCSASPETIKCKFMAWMRMSGRNCFLIDELLAIAELKN